MNKGIIFVGGFAIGFVGGWYLLKDTYKRMAEDEIEAVRERYLKWAERKRHEAEETEQKAEEALRSTRHLLSARTPLASSTPTSSPLSTSGRMRSIRGSPFTSIRTAFWQAKTTNRWTWKW